MNILIFDTNKNSLSNNWTDYFSIYMEIRLKYLQNTILRLYI